MELRKTPSTPTPPGSGPVPDSGSGPIPASGPGSVSASDSGENTGPGFSPRRRLAWVAVGILVCAALQLAALETALWYWRPVFRSGGLVQKPNGVVFNIAQPRDNRDGFIDEEHPRKKRPGGFRVIGVDGSLGATGDLKTNLFSVMRHTFRRAGLPQVEVINHSVPAAPLACDYTMLTEHTADFDPDVVVIFVDAIQYAFDWSEMMNPLVADGIIYFNPPIRYITWFYAKAIRQRTVSALLRDQAKAEMPGTKNATGDIPDPKVKPAHIDHRDTAPGGLFSPWEYLVFNYRLMHTFTKTRGSAYKDNFDHDMEWIRKIRAACEEQGAQLFVVVFPAEMQTNPALGQAIFDYFELDPSLYDYSIPYNDTLAWLRENNIPALGILDDFLSVPDPVEIFFPRNIHLSDFGQEVTGKAIAQALMERGLVPKPRGE